MRTVTSLTCASLVALLSACTGPSDGYYDSRGNYISNHRNDRNSFNHSPLPGDSNSYAYDRRGYYDYNGEYVDQENDISVPKNMFPPRGKCRVWFTDRADSNQPDIETCNGIRTRVPNGAYVIYGG